MLAFLLNSLLLFSAPAESGAHASEGGFIEFWNTYFNYPGFELWRFFNLTVFVLLMIYILRKPLSQAFKAKRETIRAELIRAEEEKRAALDKLTAAEAKLVRLNMEAEQIQTQAHHEADAEKQRIAQQTLHDINKMRQQAEAEIERLSLQTKSELRRYSAEESIRLAEEKIKASMNAEKDAQLVRANIQAIGGLN